MKNILCPIDFSASSLNALEFAAKLALQLGMRLSLLYVFTEKEFLSILKKDDSLQQFEHANKLAEEKLKEVTQNLKLEFGENLNCKYHIEIGVVSKTIVEHIQNGDFELIVMGNKGINNLEENTIGSNTHYVLEKSTVPLLCIPLQAFYHEFKQIVYASDYHEQDKMALQQILTLFVKQSPLIRIVHISVVDSEEEQERFRQYTEELKSFIDYPSLQLIHKASNEKIPNVLDEYMHECQGNLLVLLKQKRNILEKLFHQSVTKKMSCFADFPVLIINGQNENN